MMLGLSALLAALVAAPARADDPKNDVESKDDVREQVRSLKEELAVLRRMVAAERRAADLEMRLLNARLDRIEQHLSRLGPPTTVREAGSFTPAPAVPTGTLRLINEMASTARVRVNGLEYLVPPLATRSIRGVPAGALNYQVTAFGRGVNNVQSRLGANEILTVTITDF
jgi:hypothetical protein